jgi:hypothetical protein
MLPRWWSQDDICECEVSEEVLNLSSTNYPDHGRCGDPLLQGKIPTAEPGTEPGTSWLVVRSSDNQVTRLVSEYGVGIYCCVGLSTINIHVLITQRNGKYKIIGDSLP